MVIGSNRRRGAGHGVVQRLFARLSALGVLGSAPLVGFSGGTDSTALAIAMAEARRGGRVRPWLGHVDHGARADSTADHLVVLSTAERLGLPVSIRGIPGGALGSHRGVGMEEAMRRERYLLLASTADETDSTSIMTAHHAEDQAETVLGHVIRGAGLEGAAGIRSVTRLTIPWWPSSTRARPVTVVRPLLAERRPDLAELVTSFGLAVVIDETNADVDRTRAALRHRVLPLLDSIHPDAAGSLARFAELVREVVDSAESSPSNAIGPDLPALDRFIELPVSQQRRILRRWVRDRSGIALTFERTEAARRWVLTTGSGRIELGGGWSFFREGRTIALHDRQRDKSPEPT